MRLSIANKNIQAFTVVELMIAMLLGLFLLGGILSVYLTGKQTYRTTQGISQIQGNLRFTMDVFSRDMRMAGYMPCRYQPNTSIALPDNGANSWWQNFFAQAVQGFEGDAGPNTFTPELAVETMAPNSDAVAIFKTDGYKISIVSHNENTERVNFAKSVPADVLTDGEVAVMCDSNQAALFQVWQRGFDATVDYVLYNGGATTIAPSNCTGSDGVANLGSTGTAENCDANSEKYKFRGKAQLIRYSPVIYYVAESNTNPGVLALKRRYLEARDVSGVETALMRSEELLQGIESMQIRYGIDTDDDQVANQFLRANAVAAADWDDVVSIKLGLLLISNDQVATQPDTNTYNVAGELLTAPGDRRMRQVANYTISLRNRVRTGLGAVAATPPSNDDDDDGGGGDGSLDNG